MTTVEITKEKIKKQDAELYDEDGYLIASLEEGIADYKAGRVMSFKSWEDKMKFIDEVIENNVLAEF